MPDRDALELEKQSDADVQADALTPERMPECPLGISILCVLHGLGGLVLAYVVTTTLFKSGRQADMQRSLDVIGSNYAQLVISMVLLVITAFGSAVGMCMGRKWGWWLGSFYYVNSLFRYGNVLFMAWAFSNGGQLGDPSRIYSRYPMRILINSLILLYLFRGSVLEFFGLQDRRRLRLLSELVAANVAILAISAFL